MRTLKTRFGERWELPLEYAEWNIPTLQKQYVLLTPKSSLQPWDSWSLRGMSSCSDNMWWQNHKVIAKNAKVRVFAELWKNYEVLIKNKAKCYISNAAQEWGLFSICILACSKHVICHTHEQDSNFKKVSNSIGIWKNMEHQLSFLHKLNIRSSSLHHRCYYMKSVLECSLFEIIHPCCSLIFLSQIHQR